MSVAMYCLSTGQNNVKCVLSPLHFSAIRFTRFLD